MGMIINIDEALKNRSHYNVLKEPLNQMLKNTQEAWEKENPIDFLFNRNTINSFQESYSSSIGFDHAFTETSDFAVGPIFNTAEGFSATYRTRTFQGGFIITQQAMEDRQYGKIKDDASAFVKRWHGDIVEYAMTAIAGGFGKAVDFVGGDGKVTKLQLTSADTVDGDVNNPVKNPLFSKTHKTVKREGGTAIEQSNIYKCAIDLASNDAGKISKLAYVINYVISDMENYKDDNGKYAGVSGAKQIVGPNDPLFKAAIETALSMETFGPDGPNPAYKRAVAKFTPYLRDIAPCMDTVNGSKKAIGFFIVDKAYNAENHGPELTERIPFTLDVNELKRPNGVAYDGRQRFDINVASWRGITYVCIDATGTWGAQNASGMTDIAIPATIAKEVKVVNTVSTKEQA